MTGVAARAFVLPLPDPPRPSASRAWPAGHPARGTPRHPAKADHASVRCPSSYEIRIRGRVGDHLADALGMATVVEPVDTVLRGPVADQEDLHGTPRAPPGHGARAGRDPPAPADLSSSASRKSVRAARMIVPCPTLDKPSTTGNLLRDMPGGRSDRTPSLVTQFVPPSPPFGLVERLPPARTRRARARGAGDAGLRPGRKRQDRAAVVGRSGPGRDASCRVGLARAGRRRSGALLGLGARLAAHRRRGARRVGAGGAGRHRCATRAAVFMPLLVNALAELERAGDPRARRHPRRALARVPRTTCASSSCTPRSNCGSCSARAPTRRSRYTSCGCVGV